MTCFWVTGKVAEAFRRSGGAPPWATFHLFSDCGSIRNREPQAVVLRRVRRSYQGNDRVHLGEVDVGCVCYHCHVREDREPLRSGWAAAEVRC